MLFRSAIARDHPKRLRVVLQKAGHEGALPLFEILKHLHLVRKTLLSLRPTKLLVHPTIVADPHRGAQRVLYLIHELML